MHYMHAGSPLSVLNPNINKTRGGRMAGLPLATPALSHHANAGAPVPAVPGPSAALGSFTLFKKEASRGRAAAATGRGGRKGGPAAAAAAEQQAAILITTKSVCLCRDRVLLHYSAQVLAWPCFWHLACIAGGVAHSSLTDGVPRCAYTSCRRAAVRSGWTEFTGHNPRGGPARSH